MHRVVLIFFVVCQLLQPSTETRVTRQANGCGTGRWNIDAFLREIGEDMFISCCNAHDLCYDTCGKKQLTCDQLFLHCMLEECHAGDSRCETDARLLFWIVFFTGRAAYEHAQSLHVCWHVRLFDLKRQNVTEEKNKANVRCPYERCRDVRGNEDDRRNVSHKNVRQAENPSSCTRMPRGWSGTREENWSDTTTMARKSNRETVYSRVRATETARLSLPLQVDCRSVLVVWQISSPMAFPFQYCYTLQPWEPADSLSSSPWNTSRSKSLDSLSLSRKVGVFLFLPLDWDNRRRHRACSLMYSLQSLVKCKRMLGEKGGERERETYSINHGDFSSNDWFRSNWHDDINGRDHSLISSSSADRNGVPFALIFLSVYSAKQKTINLDLSVSMLVKDWERNVWCVLALVHLDARERRNRSNVWKTTSAFDQRDELAVIQD